MPSKRLKAPAQPAAFSPDRTAALAKLGDNFHGTLGAGLSVALSSRATKDQKALARKLDAIMHGMIRLHFILISGREPYGELLPHFGGSAKYDAVLHMPKTRTKAPAQPAAHPAVAKAKKAAKADAVRPAPKAKGARRAA